MREYFSSFMGVVFLGCFVELLCANNKFKPYISLLSAMVIVLAMVAPIGNMYQSVVNGLNLTQSSWSEAKNKYKETLPQGGYEAVLMADAKEKIVHSIEGALKEQLNIDSICEIQLNVDEGSVNIERVTVCVEKEKRSKEVKNLIADFYYADKDNIYIIER